MDGMSQVFPQEIGMPGLDTKEFLGKILTPFLHWSMKEIPLQVLRKEKIWIWGQVYVE